MLLILMSGIILFAAWFAVTYLLEGRKRTLLRPEAEIDRLVYAVIANMLIGTLGPALWARWVGVHSPGAMSGFMPSNHMPLSIIAAILLGVLLLVIQKPSTWNPVVLLNGFSQTLVVSIAEVLVCWAVVGSSVAGLSAPAGKIIAVTVGLIAASIAFGLYHFAHSPPFNTLKMVIVLTAVGCVTGLFFFLSQNVYATIVFHNFLALKGVTDSLSKAGLLDRYKRVQVPLMITSLVAVGLLVGTGIFLS